MGEVCLNWKNVRRILAIGSLLVGGIATGLPDVYSKVAFAVALGLSNAAIYIKAEENDGQAGK
jgi:Sec-independent protein secretion pathway component TatC